MMENMGSAGGMGFKNMATAMTMAGYASGDPNESQITKLLRMFIKAIIYPIIFIFLMIFPYIYVTYASFKKLLKSYRNNVRTI